MELKSPDTQKETKQNTQKVPLKQRKKDFLEIFKANLCLVTQSCQKANISRSTYYLWLKGKEFNNEIQEAKVSVKDFGEEALYDLIKEKNPQSVIFFNKTKNKDRGYVEKSKQTIEHKGEGFKLVIESPTETINTRNPGKMSIKGGIEPDSCRSTSNLNKESQDGK